jgi:hypothetical protein
VIPFGTPALVGAAARGRGAPARSRRAVRRSATRAGEVAGRGEDARRRAARGGGRGPGGAGRRRVPASGGLPTARSPGLRWPGRRAKRPRVRPLSAKGVYRERGLDRSRSVRHVAVVEVDRETGSVESGSVAIAVDDCGRILNRRSYGVSSTAGIAQGIAQALFEEVVFDEVWATPSRGRLATYLMPQRGRPAARSRPPTRKPHRCEPPRRQGDRGIGLDRARRRRSRTAVRGCAVPPGRAGMWISLCSPERVLAAIGERPLTFGRQRPGTRPKVGRERAVRPPISWRPPEGDTSSID